MRRIGCALIVVLLGAGCAGHGERFSPFPPRNTDSRNGLVRNWRTVFVNLVIKDEAGRVIEEWYIAPAVDPISSLDINRSRAPVTVAKKLAPGYYSVEILPFRRNWTVIAGWQNVELPRQSASISVGRDPLALYDRYTGKHWGWILEIY
ncbi:MAG: hypothetical protein Q8R35_03275 [bacterium]|nr:hypothetical protein [bacterium]